MSTKRSFTITNVSGRVKSGNNLGGRYLSSTPASAARKAGTQICRSNKIKGQCKLVITIQETTSGSSKKEFKYKFSRVKDPVTVVRDGVEVTYNYKTSVHKSS